MAKTTSRPNSTISLDSEPGGILTKFGSGRWMRRNQVSGTRFKVCLCGRKNVGKTSIFLRLQGAEFTDEKPPSTTLNFEYFDPNDPTIDVLLNNPSNSENCTIPFNLNNSKLI